MPVTHNTTSSTITNTETRVSTYMELTYTAKTSATPFRPNFPALKR